MVILTKERFLFKFSTVRTSSENCKCKKKDKSKYLVTLFIKSASQPTATVYNTLTKLT